MTLDEARKILGLGPEEDPRPHLAEFRNAREHIAAMVRTAPNDTLADRYQKGLSDFDEALAAVEVYDKAGGFDAPPVPKVIELGTEKFVAQTSSAPTTPLVVIPKKADDEEELASSGRGLSYFAWFVILFLAATGGGWLWVKHEQSVRDQNRIRVAYLERQSSLYLDNRRWQDAATTLDEIEKLSPGSDIARRGRRSIEAGMAEEQNQFVGYWVGQALAELEAGRLDEAVAAAKQVLDKFPNEKEAKGILERVALARASQDRIAAIAAAREALKQSNWNAAATAARNILATTPDDPDAKSILADATAAMEKLAADAEMADRLLQQAIAADKGVFDQQILDWLREAASLNPSNPEIAARLEKFSSYARTIRVPGDYETPEEALDNSRDGDRVVLAAGTWKGPLTLNAGVELQGAGSTTTKVECPPEAGCAITLGPNAKGARITGIAFRHVTFATGKERFSTALVRGGNVTFTDCRFLEASGHGLAVIEGGQVTVIRSRSSDNGWDGIAAFGHGTTLEVRDCEAIGNYEHGIESWDGAAVILSNNRCEGNSRNGIHADNGLASATIEGNQLINNREFGLVLDSANAGNIASNSARGNLLGGFVVRAAAKSLKVTGNQITLNQGPGLIIERGLDASLYSGNTLGKNTGQQLVTGVDLTPPPEPAPPAPLISTPDTKGAPKATVVDEPVSEEWLKGDKHE